MKKRFITMAVAALLAAASPLVATETPVSAGAGGSCAASTFCAWAQTGFAGVNQDWTYATQSSNWPGAGGFEDGGIENNDSSAKNTHATKSVRVYKFQGYGTYLLCWPANSGGNNSPTVPFDNGSSHTWNNAC